MLSSANVTGAEVLRGKVAVVIGASRGIGRAIAMALGVAGAEVIVGCHEQLSHAKFVCKEIEERGGRAFAVSADITQPDEIAFLFDEVERVFGRSANILINSAGFCPPGYLTDISEEAWASVLDINLGGPWRCTAEFTRRFDSECGHVVNISSTAAFSPYPRSHHYVAAKAGLIGITRSLALELAPRIRVNAIAPGYVLTERHREDAERCTAMAKETPLGRLVRPEEIAGICLLLISSDAPITGQVIVVDGGHGI